MGFRRAAKVDGNQKQITRELRALGFRVDITSQLKKLYDLVVTGRVYSTNDIRTVRVELKMPGEKLTPDEAKYHRSEPFPETLLIAENTEDILEWFSIKKDYLKSVEDTANAYAENQRTTRTTALSTTSKAKGSQNIQN